MNCTSVLCGPVKSEVVLEVDFKDLPKFQSQATNKIKTWKKSPVNLWPESPMIHLIFPNYSRPHNTQCGDLSHWQHSLSSFTFVVLHKWRHFYHMSVQKSETLLLNNSPEHRKWNVWCLTGTIPQIPCIIIALWP